MGLDRGAMKTEHNGAKNGGGARCPREDAKQASRKRRRRNDQAATREIDDESTAAGRTRRRMRQFPRVLAYLAQDD